MGPPGGSATEPNVSSARAGPASPIASEASALDTNVATVIFVIFKRLLCSLAGGSRTGSAGLAPLSACCLPIFYRKHAGRHRCSRWQDVYRAWQDRNDRLVTATPA